MGDIISSAPSAGNWGLDLSSGRSEKGIKFLLRLMNTAA